MAHNRISVTFTPCSPTPDLGYKVLYRPLGTSITYRDGGNFTTSPAVIEDINDAAGTKYEGILKGQCSSDLYGGNAYFTTP